jgi:hypothetical protein
MIDIKERTKKHLKKNYDIEENVTQALFDSGILEVHNCRRVLIVEEYNNKVEISGKQMLKNFLADRFCVSLSSVEKYLSEENHITP